MVAWSVSASSPHPTPLPPLLCSIYMHLSPTHLQLASDFLSTVLLQPLSPSSCSSILYRLLFQTKRALLDGSWADCGRHTCPRPYSQTTRIFPSVHCLANVNGTRETSGIKNLKNWSHDISASSFFFYRVGLLVIRVALLLFFASHVLKLYIPNVCKRP